MPGEHPNCGPGIQNASGFSYLPEDFNQRNNYENYNMFDNDIIFNGLYENIY